MKRIIFGLILITALGAAVSIAQNSNMGG